MKTEKLIIGAVAIFAGYKLLWQPYKNKQKEAEQQKKAIEKADDEFDETDDDFANIVTGAGYSIWPNEWVDGVTLIRRDDTVSYFNNASYGMAAAYRPALIPDSLRHGWGQAGGVRKPYFNAITPYGCQSCDIYVSPQLSIKGCLDASGKCVQRKSRRGGNSIV